MDAVTSLPIVSRIYHVDPTSCPPPHSANQKCRGKKNNPNCLCGLIPPPTGYRMTGLWMKVPEVVSKLGRDPRDIARSDPRRPVGLTNLGATCYMNAVLQLMYHVEPFRQGIFDLEGPVTDDLLVKVLRKVFAEMHAGPHSVVDTTAFSATLGVKLDVQQDGSEFQGIFLHGNSGLVCGLTHTQIYTHTHTHIHMHMHMHIHIYIHTHTHIHIHTHIHTHTSLTPFPGRDRVWSGTPPRVSPNCANGCSNQVSLQRRDAPVATSHDGSNPCTTSP